MKNNKSILIMLLTCLVIILLMQLIPQPAYANQSGNTLNVGDYVTFGRYLDAPIKWRVVEKTPEEVLLYSEHILTYRPYDGALSGNYGTGDTDADKIGSNYWTECNLRDWLNSMDEVVNFKKPPPTPGAVKEGLNAYNNDSGFMAQFTQNDFDAIALSEQGDHVFVLSNNEIRQYIAQKGFNVSALPTPQARAASEITIGPGTYSAHWLRDPFVSVFAGQGSVIPEGNLGTVVNIDSREPADGSVGVRPAILLNTNSIITFSGDGSLNNPYRTETISMDDIVEVKSDKIWTVSFNKDVKDNELNKEYIQILDSNGKEIPVEITVGEKEYEDHGFSQKVVVLEPPEGGYKLNNIYTLIINERFEAEAGRKLNKTYIKKFKIVETPEEEIDKPQQIKDEEMNIEINMEMNDIEKEMMIIEKNESAKEMTGTQGLVGEPISIYTPLAQEIDAEIAMGYNKGDLGNIKEENIRMFYCNYETERLELVENQRTDTKESKVYANINHFSTYVLGDISEWEKTISDNLIKPLPTDPNVVNIERNPLDIIFVIDSSGSMGPPYDSTPASDYYKFNNDLNNYRISGTKRLVDTLEDNDRAAVVKFDTTARLLSPLTFNREIVKASADLIGHYDGTNIPAGLKEALKELANNTRGIASKVIILLTDGMDSLSGRTIYWDPDYTDNIKKANQLGVRIYTVGLGDYINEDFLSRLAYETNADFIKLADSDSINTSFDEIIEKEGIDINIDTDGDGIPDWIEKSGYYFEGTLGKYIKPTDPNNPDTDGDGFKDSEEIGDFYYDESSRKVIISRDSKYTSGENKRPYQSDPNNSKETPETWLLPTKKYNPKTAIVSAYASKYAYDDSINNATVLINNGFFELKVVEKFNLNIFNGTVAKMEALMGYKPLNDGKKAILIAFRGSRGVCDWLTDSICHSKTMPYYSDEAQKVVLHAGFADYTNAFIDEMDTYSIDNKSLNRIIDLNKLSKEEKDKDIFIITGHSLGGAAAQIFAGHLKDKGIKNINCYTFGAPPIAITGEGYFDSINIKRVYNDMDPVVNIPSKIPLYREEHSFKTLNLKHVNTGINVPIECSDKQIQEMDKHIAVYNKKNILGKIISAPKLLINLLGEWMDFHNLDNMYIEYLYRVE